MARQPKWAKGKYTPKNPQKYVGKGKPIFRSSYELTFMQHCDSSPHMKRWASEPLRIPYLNPITGKKTTYVPDFLIEYVDKFGKTHVELIEIKPYNQSYITEKTTPKMRGTIKVNQAKWFAAKLWCKENGVRFRVVTEKDLFVLL